jgi:hypothetical protein
MAGDQKPPDHGLEILDRQAENRHIRCAKIEVWNVDFALGSQVVDMIVCDRLTMMDSPNP